ncbi:MAG: hypothetical protein EAZ60_27820 [Oscillatoriales cyanobacterium]|nr:MAG: hypothetical protein EAZ83_15910 [Oscillatoriales cyanobacterium]TAE98505.1 MAG: hypothetical protein EAZ79_07375 [Oscillatoriales cyanobacterium]TAF18712.1 MAG: hypothetical protein EAZ73_17360 [Oscillatoriales cyanobacterium]TAF33534.1 MAG: hypothetical protein EAZ69_16105 [Oscillatoriales cyanobacterium]TAF50827.1 MAG: hypothetical protein EAZ60_27820 [Oscillatoriales cyanobacterium]
MKYRMIFFWGICLLDCIQSPDSKPGLIGGKSSENQLSGNCSQKPGFLPRTYLKAEMLRGCYRLVRYY